MRQSDVIKFQKALVLAASAANLHEAEAAELAARRVMTSCNLDPTRIPNGSFYSQHNFADSVLLKQLRDEYREAHPHKPVNTKPKAKRRKPAGTLAWDVNLGIDWPTFDQPVNTSQPEPEPASSPFDFDPPKAARGPVNTSQPEPEAKPEAVNTKPSSDRSRDRHSPGYMREYMRRRRAAQKPSP
jgi:hypothetical protein